ncbi:hypothetical protein PG997_009011 [Apiospora hydei]|uniref:Uncharacterized protein n=1 Tax=Apiospora hydei TaxID=1337664 RepID=A0ABR1WCF6_9PEZI
MPEQSYTLLLDASESREQSTRLFQDVTQRLAAWQDVWERVARERGIKSLKYIRDADNSDIANDASPIIKTTFDASRGYYDADTEFAKYSDRDIEDVRFIMQTELLDSFDPVSREVTRPDRWSAPEPLLPSYKGLLAETILPEFFQDQDWSRVDEYDSGESESEDGSEENADDDADNDDEEEAATQEQDDNGLAQDLQVSASTVGVNSDGGAADQMQQLSDQLSADESDDEMVHSDHSG